MSCVLHGRRSDTLFKWQIDLRAARNLKALQALITNEWMSLSSFEYLIKH